MKLYFQTFLKVLLGMLEKPMWMLLIISLCVMSLVYVHPVLWDLPVAVVDQDNTVASRSLVRELDATAKVELHSYDNLATARQDMIMRDLFAIIIIPQDFERNLLQGKNITVPVFGDGTNRIASGQIQQELGKAYQQILADYNTKILTANGYTPEQASILIAPIQSETVGYV